MNKKELITRYGFLVIKEQSIEYLNQIVESIETIEAIEIVKIYNFNIHNKRDRDLAKQIYNSLSNSNSLKRENKKGVKNLFLVIFKNYISYDCLFSDIDSKREIIIDIKERLKKKFNENQQKIINIEIYIFNDLFRTEEIFKLLKLSSINFENQRIGGIPYFIDFWKKIQIKRIPIDQLYAVIIEKRGKSIVKIDKTPHYKALVEDINIYKNYFTFLQSGGLCDYYSMKKLQSLKEHFEYLKGKYKSNFIFVSKLDDKYVLLDGVHRAAVLRSRGEKSLIVAEVK